MNPFQRFRRSFVLIEIALWLATGAASDAATPQLTAHFIDVGQGASALLEFPCGAVLIDAGAQDDAHEDHLAEFLVRFFQRRTDLNNTLSTVIVTHRHIDHSQTLPLLAQDFVVDVPLDACPAIA